MKIYPSLISSDLLNLGATIAELDAHCDGYHIDVMDDHFVPNLTWGPAFVNAIRATTKLPLHVHLMVDNPYNWPTRLKLVSGDLVIFHQETIDADKQKALIATIKTKGLLAGIALNPKTAAEHIFDILPLIDHVLIMSVEPGFSGQHFISEVTKKINPLIALRSRHNLSFTIGMDGGINQSNIASLKQNNIDMVGVAAAIFGQPDPVIALKNLYT